jgi:hypothetical protein
MNYTYNILHKSDTENQSAFCHHHHGLMDLLYKFTPNQDKVTTID